MHAVRDMYARMRGEMHCHALALHALIIAAAAAVGKPCVFCGKADVLR
jgi:hypothetical protein